MARGGHYLCAKSEPQKTSMFTWIFDTKSETGGSVHRAEAADLVGTDNDCKSGSGDGHLGTCFFFFLTVYIFLQAISKKAGLGGRESGVDREEDLTYLIFT